MIPLHDDNPTHKIPFVTIALIAACVIIFLFQFSQQGAMGQAFVYAYAFIPARLFGDALLPPNLPFTAASPVASMFSSMFLHGDFMHLGGNMLYLWTFGDNIENRLGWPKFILFYIACGLAAALAQGLLDPTSTIPMIGASGAISGVLGGYLVLFPKVPVSVYFPYTGVTRMPAFMVLLMWFGYQLALGLMSLNSGQEGGVAFWAHIGGFAAGWVLIRLFVTQKQRLNLWEE